MLIDKVCKMIKENDNFLISAHYEPEGDSLGSQLAMADILKQLGKKFVIVNPDAPPARYNFLKGIDQVIPIKDKKTVYDFDIALILDCPIIERIGAVSKVIEGKIIVNVDHHISNKEFGSVNYVDPAASSTGEIMYELALKLGCKLNKDISQYIYLSMLTDTGGFRYSNTTAKTMRIASELLKAGANPKELYEKIYESHSLASRKLLALCLGTLKVSKDGKAAWMCLTQAMFKKTKSAKHDAENFVNFARFIDGVKIAVLFTESVKKGVVHVSFRSNDVSLDVNKIAGVFGGGGHVSASGCTVEGSLSSVEKKVLAEIKKIIG